jgi:hypothetical protein
MTTQEIAAVIAAFSALFSAISAGVNFYNTKAFLRQLASTTTDACLATSGALKAAVHKTVELKANKVDNITPQEIRDAYSDAWTKWVAFYQAFRIAQRYRPEFGKPKFDAPDQASGLLTELRDSLRDPAWIPGGPKDPRDIRAKMDELVDEIERRSGLGPALTI